MTSRNESKIFFLLIALLLGAVLWVMAMTAGERRRCEDAGGVLVKSSSVGYECVSPRAPRVRE